MKVKSDSRSKFSNLSNWKEEAWRALSKISFKCTELIRKGLSLSYVYVALNSFLQNLKTKRIAVFLTSKVTPSIFTHCLNSLPVPIHTLGRRGIVRGRSLSQWLWPELETRPLDLESSTRQRFGDRASQKTQHAVTLSGTRTWTLSLTPKRFSLLVNICSNGKFLAIKHDQTLSLSDQRISCLHTVFDKIWTSTNIWSATVKHLARWDGSTDMFYTVWPVTQLSINIFDQQTMSDRVSSPNIFCLDRG